MAELTQHQKIVAIMCINKSKEWWKPHEIMDAGKQEFFIGYEASARLSELAKDYPDMIESKREGKYYVRRMRFETGGAWFPGLPKHLQDIVRKHYRKPVPVETPKAVYVGLEV